MPTREHVRISTAIAAVRERRRTRELAYTFDPGLALARAIVTREEGAAWADRINEPTQQIRRIKT